MSPPPQVGFPSLPAKPQVPVHNTGKRSEEDILPVTHRMMNPSPTRQTSRRPRVISGTPPWTWLSWMMTTMPLCPGKPRVREKTRTQTSAEEEAIEALVNRLKGEARAIQYNLELAILTEYRNLHIPNLKGAPNTDNHSAYLSVVKDVSWSYPTKGNLITAQQYYQDLKASKDPEAIEA